MAATLDRSEIASELISADADVDIKDGFDFSPLDIATAADHLEIVNQLIAAGAEKKPLTPQQEVIVQQQIEE
ncbi:MAG: hypothetical protein OXI08_01725 [Cyanobacteria bacterium MAG IRC4_bin_6]|nr:hypothetical protein [Cyanobacteria bacterium MAG IRC3_bin_20]MDE0646783.1 hypothetical protein [Cyanobacteria bacterium MAG IRC4_bin_6]